MALASTYAVNKSSKSSSVILVADSDFYFKANTKAISVVDSNPANPKMTVVSSRVLDSRRRMLLVHFKVQPGKGPVVEKTPDIVTGAITITLNDPPASTVVGVGYVDDDETP